MVIPTEVIITQNFTITAFNQLNNKKWSKRVHVWPYINLLDWAEPRWVQTFNGKHCRLAPINKLLANKEHKEPETWKRARSWNLAKSKILISGKRVKFWNLLKSRILKPSKESEILKPERRARFWTETWQRARLWTETWQRVRSWNLAKSKILKPGKGGDVEILHRARLWNLAQSEIWNLAKSKILKPDTERDFSTWQRARFLHLAKKAKFWNLAKSKILPTFKVYLTIKYLLLCFFMNPVNPASGHFSGWTYFKLVASALNVLYSHLYVIASIGSVNLPCPSPNLEQPVCACAQRALTVHKLTI